MIDPHIIPKHDFTPATNGTAFRNADDLSDIVYKNTLSISRKPKLAMKMKMHAFTQAVNGAAMLQNLMDGRKVKNG